LVPSIEHASVRGRMLVRLRSTHARRRAALAEDEWRLGGSGGLRRVVAQAVEREGWG
jgi:hypothetical protein